MTHEGWVSNNGDTTIKVYVGDALESLSNLPDGSVDCCVTSPPYFGLRDYGVEGQIGLEDTPEQYVARLVKVFREVRRVLSSTATLWLNLGDSYAGSWGNQGRKAERGTQRPINGEMMQPVHDGRYPAKESNTGALPPGLKPKDMVGIPWRVAFALQADGWVLRSDIVWSKPNPMPESVRDRPTKSHETLFLFSKAKWVGPENGRFGSISDADARWLALCIDTEGCITVKRVKQNDGGADTFGPQVTFGGTNLSLVEKFKEIVGHGNILVRPGKNAPMNYWQIANNLARDFLHRIYPYLIVKQRQARIAIYVDDLVYHRGGQFPSRKRRTEKENNILLSLWARNKQCNQFGDPDLSDIPEPRYGKWDSQPYFYDAEAIKEPISMTDGRTWQSPGRNNGLDNPKTPDPKKKQDALGKNTYTGFNGRYRMAPVESRNRRTVWEIATEPFPEAHFATFPQALVLPCIMAGTKRGG